MSEPISETFEQFQPIQPAAAAEPVKPSPNNPPWGPGLAIGAWVISVVLIIIIPGLFLAPYVISRGGEFADSAEMVKALTTDPVAIVIQIVAIIPAHLLTLALAWLVVTNGRKFSFTEMLGWRSGGMQWWYHAAIMGGFFVLVVAVSALLPEQENEMMRILKSSRSAVFLVAFMAVVTAPLVEEVIYRGLLYSALQRTLGPGFAVALVTFLFALVHLPQYYPSVSTMILLTLLSLILTLIRMKTDNLLPCIVLHTIFNGFQSALLIVEPYIQIDSTVEDTLTAMILSIK